MVKNKINDSKRLNPKIEAAKGAALGSLSPLALPAVLAYNGDDVSPIFDGIFSTSPETRKAVYVTTAAIAGVGAIAGGIIGYQSAQKNNNLIDEANSKLAGLSAEHDDILNPSNIKSSRIS